MVAQGPGAKLHAVEDEVVLRSPNGERLALEERHGGGGRQAERVVTVREAPRLRVDLEQRELLDPEQRPARAGLRREERDERQAQRAEDAGRDERFVGGEDDEVAGFRRRALDQRDLLGLAEELDDGAAQGAALLDVDVGHAFGAVLLGAAP